MTVQASTSSGLTGNKPIGRDIFSGLVFLTLGLVLLALGVHAFEQYPVLWPFTADQLHWWHTLPLALTCIATWYQTRYPLAVYWIITGVLIIDMTMGVHLAVLLVWGNAVYNTARYTPGRMLRWSLVGIGLAIFVWIVALTGDLGRSVGGIFQVVVVAVISLWWGSEVRGGYERAEMERLKSLAARRREELERQELLRRQRADFAAQLHDTISSHLSTIALYTTGALDMPRQADKDRNVLAEIRHAALAALKDMRELIDVLRTFTTQDDHNQLVTHDPVSLDELLQRLRSAGLELSVTGKPVDSINRLEPAAARLVTQVVQEALTNAYKHGDGTASLDIVVDDDVMTCSIKNPMPSISIDQVSQTPTGLSGGFGLGSMAAAVDDLGGCFTAGVHSDKGHRFWTVSVELPVTPNHHGHAQTAGNNPKE
ncbi:sensor histidine kinase [Enteractinococcus helveticum]|uniref:histidine kinase n=1 Tax=Enteractinococcus helveticum TaxID=1837282 RepID=A0A1B7LXQ3_9MICC|nr:histidine kinase [Enteractinococcus helveticum]OAV59947.1 hypothetical protein A6F49_14485 [Enteractinococcus helveticum]